MIVILEHLGVKEESFVLRQDQAVNDIKASRDSLLEASKLFVVHKHHKSVQTRLLFTIKSLSIIYRRKGTGSRYRGQFKSGVSELHLSLRWVNLT